MTKPQTRLLQQGLILASVSVLVTVTFNCAPNMFMAAQYWNGDASSQSFTAPDSPWVLLTSDQQFQTMLNVTGQTGTMTTQQKAEYDLRTGSMSGTDNIAGVNGPLMVGTTSLAGEVCNGLIMKEKALGADSRAFFNSVDFTKPVSGNDPQSYVDVASRMARAFYGRDLGDEESQVLTGYYQDFVSGLPADTASQTQNLYLTLCAAMLSSFDAQTY